jgi:hypothetical protein
LKIRKIKNMSFTTKIAVVFAAALILSPIAASADSTAAAVSIKFKPCDTCSSNGGFSITPGANASGGGAGVSELSAAVATGETSAIANSASGKDGTIANASGWSAPVSFAYEAVNMFAAKQNVYDSNSVSVFQQEAALAFASNQNQYQYGSAQNSEFATAKITANSLDATTYDQASQQGGSGNNNNVVLNSNSKANAVNTNTGKGSSSSVDNATRTTYVYSGPSTGLKYLPGLVK